MVFLHLCLRMGGYPGFRKTHVLTPIDWPYQNKENPKYNSKIQIRNWNFSNQNKMNQFSDSDQRLSSWNLHRILFYNREFRFPIESINQIQAYMERNFNRLKKEEEEIEPLQSPLLWRKNRMKIPPQVAAAIPKTRNNCKEDLKKIDAHSRTKSKVRTCLDVWEIKTLEI